MFPVDEILVCLGLAVATVAAVVLFRTLWNEFHSAPPLCENCGCEGCVATRWCEGCDAWLCERCWLEHNKDAPCHVPGCCDVAS